jgi:hypothetical protein
MRFMTMRILFTVLLVCVFSPVYGMVYTWTDVGGVIHFTNKEYEVPTRYRPRTKVLYPEQGDTGTSQQSIKTPQTITEVSPAPVQQAKPEEPARITQPVIAPEPQTIPTDHPNRRARRSRASSSEE